MREPGPGRLPSSNEYPVKRRDNGDWVFVGFVLDKDPLEETILQGGGGLMTVERSAVMSMIPCQDEPDFDPRSDAPFLAWLSGIHPDQQDLPCAKVVTSRR